MAASIGGVSPTGEWDATLHAGDNQALSDRTRYPLTKYPEADPAGVAGRFEASNADTQLRIRASPSPVPLR